MPSASQSYPSPSDLGTRLPVTISSGPFPCLIRHAQPFQWSQRSKSEDLDFQNFLAPPGHHFYPPQGTPVAAPAPAPAPATVQHAAASVMDWGLRGIGSGQECGRAWRLGQGRTGDLAHLTATLLRSLGD